MTVLIAFETHATSTDNKAGIATGWLDGELSAVGRRQAAELGGRRRGAGFAKVFTSDLARAVETAEIAFGGSRVGIVRDPRLRECNYGAMNGMPAARIHAIRARRIDRRFPDGESYRDVVARVASFLGDLPPRFDEQSVIVIGHSATRWALDHLLVGTDLTARVAAEFEWRPGWTYTLRTEEHVRPTA